MAAMAVMGMATMREQHRRTADMNRAIRVAIASVPTDRPPVVVATDVRSPATPGRSWTTPACC